MTLRPLDPERDGSALHAIFGDEESCRFLPHRAKESVAQTVSMLRSWTDGYEDTSWAIVEGADGPAVGRVALYRPGADPEIWEAAIMIAPAARGRGLAAPAMARALDRVFAEKGARRVFADIDPENAASIRLFERLGFSLEGRLRAHWRTHIGVRDSFIYALLAADPRPAVNA